MKKLILASLAVAAALQAPQLVSAQAQHTMATTPSALALRQDMRKLWTDHVVWTRDYIVAAVDDRPDAQAAATRLMKNQDDIGAAVGSFYGKAGDKAAQAAAGAKWNQNGDAIATFLSKANPNWPKATLAEMMNGHLKTTTDEVVARLTKNWDADVRAYDAVYAHILMMADALSDGIIKQFPAKFAG